jgi:hypothetical protein
MKALVKLFLVSALVSAACSLPAMADDQLNVHPEAAASRVLIEPDSLANLEAIQTAITEALRLKDQCNASDIRLCQPEPPCDAQGQRPEPWQDCVLAWGPGGTDKEALTWVDGWKVDNANLGYRKPVLGADGKLY